MVTAGSLQLEWRELAHKSPECRDTQHGGLQPDEPKTLFPIDCFKTNLPQTLANLTGVPVYAPTGTIHVALQGTTLDDENTDPSTTPWVLYQKGKPPEFNVHPPLMPIPQNSK